MSNSSADYILMYVVCRFVFYLASNCRLQTELPADNQDGRFQNHIQILYSYLLVRRVHPNPVILSTQSLVLSKGVLARYNTKRVDLKTFTFSAGSKSLSIEKAVLGPNTKRLLYTMIKNAYLKAHWTPTRTYFGTTISTNTRSL